MATYPFQQLSTAPRSESAQTGGPRAPRRPLRDTLAAGRSRPRGHAPGNVPDPQRIATEGVSPLLRPAVAGVTASDWRAEPALHAFQPLPLGGIVRLDGRRGAPRSTRAARLFVNHGPKRRRGRLGDRWWRTPRYSSCLPAGGRSHTPARRAGYAKSSINTGRKALIAKDGIRKIGARQ